jgi:N-acyl-D-aspartate/D-glutamate deacylase
MPDRLFPDGDVGKTVTDGQKMFDVVIQQGWVFDGLGQPPMLADIGVTDGQITAIAPSLASQPRHETVDATGLWVTPGFVDIHTHYDLELEIAPGLSESVRHGVTTVVIGNCSLSIAVGEPKVLADIFQRVETLSNRLIDKWLDRSMDWQSPAEYLQHLDQLVLGPNVAPMFGHSALRAQVMGLERSLTQSKPTPIELATMRSIASSALDAGFIGISIDMFPWHRMGGIWGGQTIPSQHAEYREYAMLAQLCRRTDRVFQTTPNLQRLSSFLEILWMGAGWGRKPLRLTMLSALDAVHDRRLWRLYTPLLWFWNRLLGGNVRLQTLTEPFTIYSDGPVTPLFEEFPTGAALNGCADRAARLALWSSPGFTDRFRQEWTAKGLKSFHRNLALMQIIDCPETSWAGSSFLQAADTGQQNPVEFFIQGLQQYDTDLRWVATGANDRLRERLKLMQHPEILPGFTDAGAHVRNLGYYDGAISLLKQAMTTGFLTPDRAIARVTGEPAQWFGLDTGVLRVGAQADLLLLNPSALMSEISPQVPIADPVLDGEVRLVKRGSGEIVRSVYIRGVLVVQAGEVLPVLGRDRLGRALTGRCFQEQITPEITDHPFTNYWDVFVLKHQHPVNVFLHLVGIGFFYGLLLAVLLGQNPWLLLALPVTQGIGLLGHWLFERSHVDRGDAVFSWRASVCLGRLLWRVLTGRYGEDVRQRLVLLEEYRAERSP